MMPTLKKAFIATVPVFAGYLVLGFGFGIMLHAAGYGILLAFIMSLTIYAGSMQYLAVGLLVNDASLITVAVTTFVVNVRHLFYGISMLDKYKGVGKIKGYLMFALTDETYSLLCIDNPIVPESKRRQYYFFVSLLDHSYWILGSVLGATIGTLIDFNSQGVDFALTALFVTIFLDQWLNNKKHIPAIIGVVATALSVVVFGSQNFLIPAMIMIAVALCLYKEEKEND